MAINDVMGLTVELEASTDKFVSDLQKAAGKVELDFDPGKLVKSFGKAQKGVKETFAKTVAEAASMGLSKANIDKFTKKLDPLKEKLESSLARVFKLQIDAREKGIDASIKKEREAALAIERQKHVALEHRYNWEKKSTDRLLDRRKKALGEAERLSARTSSEAAEEFGKGISSAFSDLKSGNFAGVLKGVGKGAEARGAGAEAKGVRKGGIMGKALAGIGKALGGLGKALLAIGALAAGIGALLAIVFGADAAMKSLNKTMFDSGMAAGEVADEYGKVGDTLSEIRKGFTSGEGAFDFNRMWGTTAKDHLEILGAYSKAGLTFKELKQSFAGAATEARGLRDATEMALVYAKLLGTSNVEMAETFATRMEEMGQSIDGVRESLSAVHIAARESGFGVKRFFNMVLQATAGMSMYNVRMEEAAGLLMRLGGILGAKAGGDFLGTLTKGFGDESTQDKYKRVKTTGGGNTKAAFERSAKSMAGGFVDALADKDLGGEFAAAASRAKLEVNFANKDELVRDLGKLDASQQTRLLAEARQSGDQDMVRTLTNLMMVSQGAKGGTGRMAMNLGGLDMGGKMMMMLQQGSAIIKKPLHEMTLKQTMAFENITGVSGQQLEELRRVSQAMHGNHKTLMDLKADTGLYADKTDRQRARMQEDQVKAYGAYIDKEGNLIAAKLDAEGNIDTATQKEIGDKLGDYVQSQGDVFAEAARQSQTADILLAKDLASNTTEITKLLEQGVEFWLSRIHEWTLKIWGWLSNKEDKAQQEALAVLADEMRQSRVAIAKQEKVVAGLKADFTAEKNPVDKARIKTALEVAQRQLEIDKKGLALADKASIGVARKGTSWLGDQDVQDYLGNREGVDAGFSKKDLQQMGQAGADRARKAHLERLYETSDIDAYSQREGITGEDVDKFETQGHFAGRAGREAVLARAEGRRATPLSTLVESPGMRLQQVSEQMGGVGGSFLGAIAGLVGSDSPAMTGRRSGKTMGIGGEKGVDELQTTMKDVVVDDLVAAGHKDLVEKEKADKKLHGKGGAAPKEIADKMRIVFEETLTKQEREQAETDLSNILDLAGVKMSEGDISKTLDKMRKGKMPDAVKKVLDKEVSGGMFSGETVEDLLRKSGLPAHDFLMQVGTGGRLKFAQRIDSADQVTALASKGGGAVSQAARGKGSGGGVVINSFGNAAEVVRGIQAAVSAGVV
jgi:hypothetical protein